MIESHSLSHTISSAGYCGKFITITSSLSGVESVKSHLLPDTVCYKHTIRSHVVLSTRFPYVITVSDLQWFTARGDDYLKTHEPEVSISDQFDNLSDT